METLGFWSWRELPSCGTRPSLSLSLTLAFPWQIIAGMLLRGCFGTYGNNAPSGRHKTSLVEIWRRKDGPAPSSRVLPESRALLCVTCILPFCLPGVLPPSSMPIASLSGLCRLSLPVFKGKKTLSPAGQQTKMSPEGYFSFDPVYLETEEACLLVPTQGYFPSERPRRVTLSEEAYIDQ